MAQLNWLDLFQGPLDVLGFVLFVFLFPVYHGLYPLLMKLLPGHATKTSFDLYRRSWIERLIERHDVLLAAQQIRNLTMVNTVLASSALILMGFTANLLIQMPLASEGVPGATGWWSNPETQAAKLLLLIVIFGVAFAYCMTALRHLGHFNLVIGADPQLLDSHEGSAVDYLSGLVNRASSRYTLAVRCLFSASPVFLWLFDSRLFLILTSFWAVKFLVFQDFHFLQRRRP